MARWKSLLGREFRVKTDVLTPGGTKVLIKAGGKIMSLSPKPSAGRLRVINPEGRKTPITVMIDNLEPIG